MDHLEEEHWWFKGRRMLLGKLLEKYASDLPINSQSTEQCITTPLILDIGSGTGGNIPIIKKYGRVLDLEYSRDALVFARTKYPVQTIQADAQVVPMTDRSVDIVVMLDVLEHLDEDAKALSEVYRILKPGGTLILTVPAYPRLWSANDVVNHHRRRYMAGQLQALMQEAKLDIIRFTHWNFILFPLLLLARTFRKVPEGARPQDLKGDIGEVPESANTLLLKVLDMENRMISRGATLPFGVTLVCVARKPE